MAPISFSDSDAIPDLPISHEDRAANGLPSPTPGHAGRTAADLAARKMADPLAPTDPTKRIEDARLHSRC